LGADELPVMEESNNIITEVEESKVFMKSSIMRSPSKPVPA
jgi:hypothetical protein